MLSQPSCTRGASLLPSRRRHRVLVLGGGFLGAHIASRLIHQGWQVTVFTRSRPRPELANLLDGVAQIRGDVNSTATLGHAVAMADHVVYAVGSSSPVESDIDPAHDIEVTLPPLVRLLELLKSRRDVDLTFLSSGGTVYGNTLPGPTNERTLPVPVNSYGLLKLSAEWYLQLYATQRAVPVRILRVANAYGPGQAWTKGQGVIARLMHCALSGEPFRIFGDGTSVRDYIYVGDVAAVVCDLLGANDSHRVLNIGSGIGHSVNDVIRIVESVSRRSIVVEHRGPRPFDVRSVVLDVRLLRKVVSFEPTPLETGIALTWEAFRCGEAGLSNQPTRRDYLEPTR